MQFSLCTRVRNFLYTTGPGLSVVETRPPRPEQCASVPVCPCARVRTLAAPAAMAMPIHANGSFASPLANPDYPAPLHHEAAGLRSLVYDGLSGFNLVALLLLATVLYDQCGSMSIEFPSVATWVGGAADRVQSGTSGTSEVLWDPC